MDVDARVAVLGDDRLAGVQAHADANVVLSRPRVLDQCALRGDCRRCGGAGIDEGGEELVAVGVDHGAVVARHRFPEDAALVGQDLGDTPRLRPGRGGSTPRGRRAEN